MKNRPIRTACATIALAFCAAFALAQPTRAASDDRVSRLLAESRAGARGSGFEARQDARGRFQDQRGRHLGDRQRRGKRSADRGMPSRIALPRCAGGDGYDGTDAWNQDGSGLVWVDGGQAGRAQAIAKDFSGGYALWKRQSRRRHRYPGGARETRRATSTTYCRSPAGVRSTLRAVVRSGDPLAARIVQTIGPNSSDDDLSAVPSGRRPHDAVRDSYRVERR